MIEDLLNFKEVNRGSDVALLYEENKKLLELVGELEGKIRTLVAIKHSIRIEQEN